MNCLPLSEWNYFKYVNSHNWETSENNGYFTEVCSRCGDCLQNPSGTIAFRGMCMLVPLSVINSETKRTRGGHNEKK